MGNMRRYGAPGNPETDEGREQRSGLIILQRSKDLMKYLYTSFVKYPRSEKLGFVADYKKVSVSIPDSYNHGTKEVFRENDTSRRGRSA